MNRFVTLAGERIGDLLGHVAESGRLARGRGLFRKGAVSNLTVTSGQILAVVQGSSGTPYETTVAASLATPGVIREVAEGYDPNDRHSIDDLVDDGVKIVPRVTDLAFSCTCADWEEPCKHAIAVLFAFADRVDLDEVELLRWRGIDYSPSTASEETGSSEGESTDDNGAGPNPEEASSEDDTSERSAEVEGLRGLLGDTEPAFGRRRRRRTPPPPPPNSPALAAFLAGPDDGSILDDVSLAAAPELFAGHDDGPLGQLGPQLAEAISIIVAVLVEEQIERERLDRSLS